MESLGTLITESRNSHSVHIDEVSTLEMLTVINQEDATVPAAVASQLPQIAQAVDEIAARFAQGGRLFYIGAGTSGRLGVLDASECPPTFSVPPALVQGLIAGGDHALRNSSEHSEDSPEEGARDLIAAGFGIANTADPAAPTPDVLVGIAASGRTPYVLGALLHAKSIKAFTIGLACVAGSPISKVADLTIAPVTGPEVVTGSTRMKAGTATKLVLNMLSTGVMIRTGAVYGNLMVNVKPTNDKLIDRAQRIIMAAAADSDRPIDRPAATRLLIEAGSVKTAIAMHKLGLPRAAAEELLASTGGNLSKALRPAYDTYGLDLAKLLGHSHPKLRGYRYSVRTLLPRVAYAETLLHRSHMPPDVPSPALEDFNQQIAVLSAADHWDSYRGHAGVGTHLLAGFIFILPKVGALSDLSLRGPTPSAEQDYVNSLMHTADVLRQTLAKATTSDGLPNKDLDTGRDARPGSYSLEDLTYVNLLHEASRDPASPIPFGIKRDLLAYFADLSKVTYLNQKPQLLAQVQADLPILQTISTKAAYPDSAFLPEPDQAKAPNPQPTPKNASPEPTKPISPSDPKGTAPALVPIPAQTPGSTAPKPQP